MPKFRAVGKSVDPPKEGIFAAAFSMQVDFFHVDPGKVPVWLETRTFRAADRAELEKQVKHVLNSMKDRHAHAKATTDVVGQVIDEVVIP